MAEEIICLGKKFNNEDERREYFRNELRNKLPDLKEIEGFPIGEDEDIIALSDPPYYTACPNPWLDDFIALWENEKNQLVEIGIHDPKFNVIEPFATDVSEGKNNPIYNAHSYHTKVPHPVIMRHILHYTQPGDIVLDGFAGTGMTGVAAQLCDHPDPITKYKIEKEFKEIGYSKIVWGNRKVICGDLSPIASFIAYNYNSPIDVNLFDQESKRLINELEKEWGWIFETKDKYGNVGRINFIIWSDVFSCPNCNNEIIFYDVAVDKKNGEVKNDFQCPTCSSNLTKKSLNKIKSTVYDKVLGTTIQQDKSVPVIINYSRSGKRFEKVPDEHDYELINKIETLPIPFWIPADELISGDKTSDPINKGITNVHHFHTLRNLIGLAAYWEKTSTDRIGSALKLAASAANPNFSKMRRFRSDKKGGGPLAGTLYIASIITPQNCFKSILRNAEFVQKAFNITSQNQINNSLIFTNSCTQLNIKDNSVDYIFTDPPFGANLMYSELNYLWESWLKVKTNTKKEAIKNSAQGKDSLQYHSLMTQCFSEYYRILKPGKWMTVEFSNTSAEIWNGIQNAIQRVGFIISNVAALDKKQGSFNAITSPTAVKQDLIISCYKPSLQIDTVLQLSSDAYIWDFVRDHLHHLPTHLIRENNTAIIIDRSPKILYDRVITHFLMRGMPIPIDSKDFQLGLKQRFNEIDGMIFTHDQVIDYEEKKAKNPTIYQSVWQIATESEGIEWLKRELKDKKLKYQDIMPKWMQAITAARKGDILPELRDILQQNFIEESDGNWRVPDMNEAKDRELIRNKALLKEFNNYIELAGNPKSKRMKEVRVEALRAGFKHCWGTKDFQTILLISDKIPQNLLLEDEQLLMYYDIAKDHV